MCYRAKFGQAKVHVRERIEIHWKILTRRAPTFKVTRGHWNRHGSIGYLWLPVSDPQ